MPDLTLGLPVGLSGTSGINAIAHAVEGLYAQDTNPIMQMMAKAGIEALVKALPRVAQAPNDVEARSGALYGAWLCGAVLGSVGMALHHKLCHTLSPWDAAGWHRQSGRPRRRQPLLESPSDRARRHSRPHRSRLGR